MRIIVSIAAFLFFVSLSHTLYGQSWKWGKTATGPGQSEGYFCLNDGNGNIYASGENSFSCYFGSDSIVQRGVYIVKYDTNGNYKWVRNVRTFTVNSPKWMGMCLDPYGNEYLFGTYVVEVSDAHDTLEHLGALAPNYFLEKLDSMGNPKWLKQLGTISSVLPSAGNCLASDARGNLYIACTFTDTAKLGSLIVLNDTTDRSTDIFVAKLDSSGAPLWAKGFGGSKVEEVTGISLSPNKNIYVAGNFGSTAITIGTTTLIDTGSAHGYSGNYLAKMDSNGNVIWARAAAEGAAAINDVAVNDLEEVFVTGTYHNSTLRIDSTTLPFAPFSGYCYGFLAKYDNTGFSPWVKLLQGNQVQPWMPVFDGCHNVWVSSEFGVGVCTDMIDGHTLSSPAGSHDPAIVCGWTDGGNYLYSEVLPSGGDDRSGLAPDCDGNLFLVGDYMYSTLIFGADTLSTTTGEFNFLAKYRTGTGCVCSNDGPGINAVNEVTQDIVVAIYPNPARQSFTATCEGGIPVDAALTISDMAGRPVRNINLTAHETIIPVADLAPGIYLCHINAGGSQISRKLVIMH